MSVNRITVKLFINNLDTIEITDLIPVFHRWIRDEAVPGLLIDVADYKHVPEGPGILLIGHDVDYALDLGHGRAGLLHRRKRLQAGSLAEQLHLALETAVQAAQILEQDTPLQIETDTVEITFPDRLHALNNTNTFTLFEADVLAVLRELYGVTDITLTTGSTDTRRPLTIQATIPNAPILAALAQKQVLA